MSRVEELIGRVHKSEREQIADELRRIEYLEMRGVATWEDVAKAYRLRRRAAELDNEARYAR